MVKGPQRRFFILKPLAIIAGVGLKLLPLGSHKQFESAAAMQPAAMRPDHRAEMHFCMFVYGTLKQGQRNFARYCRGVVNIEPARVLGRLYHLPFGYPMLEVPRQHILATGTRDYLHDAALLGRLAAKCVAPAFARNAIEPITDWEPIVGEIHTFDNPLTRLPPLDALENFRPGEDSLYDRVALRVLPPSDQVVWTYVASDGQLPAGARRIGPLWSD